MIGFVPVRCPASAGPELEILAVPMSEFTNKPVPIDD